jgi:hypothetical protein
VPWPGTGLHDHGASSGLLTVVQGELTERSRSRSGEAARTLRPGGVRVLPGAYLHEVVNTSLEPAVSIHVYSPGLVEMNQYAPQPAARRDVHQDI